MIQIVPDVQHVVEIKIEVRFVLISFYLIVLVLICACSPDRKPLIKEAKLRSQYEILTLSDARKMVKQMGFFDKYWNKSGSFENLFESQTIQNGNVVIDHATGLIWHQSGSTDFLNLTEANVWLRDLNTDRYAGIDTWRLPTLEEALSLMESTKMNGNFYIDPAFDRWQWCILTGDSLDLAKCWLVAFSGRVDWFDSNVRINYVRPVSSM